MLATALLSAPVQGQPVHLVDPNLDAAIRQILQIPDAELTRADMERLETVTARRRNIVTLEGFVGATNLQELDLGFNELWEVLLPDDLRNLSLLNLQGNPLVRLDAAGALPSLIELNAAECLLTNTSFLAHMPELASLDLQANDLEALDIVDTRTALRILNLGFNRVRDLSFLELLPGLQTLYLDDNGLTDLSLPGPMPELRFLSLAVNRLTELISLAKAPNLETLDLASNRSTGFLFPSGLSRLTWLNLGENALSGQELPEDLTNLLALYLDDNRIVQVPSVSRFTRLQALDLGINQIEACTIAHTLTNLQVLELRNNPLQRLVLPDVLATNALSNLVHALEASAVSVFIYPVVPHLVDSTVGEGSLRGVLQGPPGIHQVQRSSDLLEWTVAGTVTNQTGRVSVATGVDQSVGAMRTELVHYD